MKARAWDPGYEPKQVAFIATHIIKQGYGSSTNDNPYFKSPERRAIWNIGYYFKIQGWACPENCFKNPRVKNQYVCVFSGKVNNKIYVDYVEDARGNVELIHILM